MIDLNPESQSYEGFNAFAQKLTHEDGLYILACMGCASSDSSDYYSRENPDSNETQLTQE